MSSWLDIKKIFENIELMLVQSLKRNLSKHEAWEKDEGFKWSAWQAEKLKSLNAYRKTNKSIIGEFSSSIKQDTRELLEEQYAEGMALTEEEYKIYGEKISPDFFVVNDRKLNSLIKEIQVKEKVAEKAATRYMDDVYRRTIAKTQITMATGSVTLQQGIDMATKDFLAAGINCIAYKDKDGNTIRHVNIVSYVEMALRTASIRAYLQGEAKKRERLGIDTVLVSQYGACSNTCLPWQGRVYIDDFFATFTGKVSGDYGLSNNGKWYPLLSVAVAAGLFHPNCRHTLSTWIEGVSKMPKPINADKIKKTAALEKKQREMERTVRKWKRCKEGAVSDDRKKFYNQKLRAAQKDLREFVAEHNDVLRREYWREKTYGITAESNVASYLRVANPAEASIDTLKEIRRQIKMLPDSHLDILNKEVKEIRVVNEGKSGYNRKTKVMYILENPTPGEVIHECGHAIETQFGLHEEKDDDYNKLVADVIKGKTLKDLVFIPEKYGLPLFVLKDDRLISEYQGYVETNVSPDSRNIKRTMLREYFAEGYAEYIKNPNNLIKRDKSLYEYIKEKLG